MPKISQRFSPPLFCLWIVCAHVASRGTCTFFFRIHKCFWKKIFAFYRQHDERETHVAIVFNNNIIIIILLSSASLNLLHSMLKKLGTTAQINCERRDPWTSIIRRFELQFSSKKNGFLKADVIRDPDQLANKVLCQQFNESETRSPFNAINNQHEYAEKGWTSINVYIRSVLSWRRQFIELDPFKEWNVTKSMDIVNYSQCHSVDPKSNRRTFNSSPIGASTPSTVRRIPATSTVTSRDYYRNQQRPCDSSATTTLESNYFPSNYDYSAANCRYNNNNNNNPKTSDFNEVDSKMYQEMSPFYHHAHQRSCAAYNMPPTAYDMRSFGTMSGTMTAPNFEAPPAVPPPPPPPLPMPMPMYQRPHHETRVHQPTVIRPHTEPNYNNATATTSSASVNTWYQSPSVSAADQMINMLYMNNR